MIAYPRFHQDRVNLLLHLFGVPGFVGGTVYTVFALATGEGALASVGLVSVLVGFGLQAVGHRRERVPPLPFKGAGDFVVRILLEQFYRFPRYVLTGGFGAAWREAG